jgi:5-methylcytosine-specific restriction endonuclease McrA
MNAGSLFAELVLCEVCGQPVTSRRRWCSSTCKWRAWARLHPDRKYPKKRVEVKAKEPKPIVTRTCVECANAFIVPRETSQRQTCSPKCRVARLSKVLRGKKQRPTKVGLRCAQCGAEFATSRTAKQICNTCAHKNSRKASHGKHEKRAKRKGVPYVYGIKPASVFERDGWRCQLCGCKTPQRLRGKNQPTSPEVDHITPISQGGGHTWDNVQCACRACNIAKRAHIRGQFRLAI